MPNENPAPKTGANVALYLVIVLLVISVIALVAMNAMRRSTPTQLESENSTLRSRVIQLETELRNAGQPVPPSPAPTTTTPTPAPTPTSGPAPADGRVLLSADRYDDFNVFVKNADNNYKDVAQEESIYASPWNYDEPNKTAHYVDASRGFELDVPYNDAWGNNLFRLPAYDVASNGSLVWYGPIGGVEGGGWGRQYHISIVTSTSAEARVQQIRETTPVEFLEVQPTIITINGRKTVRWAESGLCTFPMLEVTGARFNIVISMTCGTGEASSFEKLETVARTIEFR